MRVPKQRLYRAIYKSGLANEKQLKIINRKLGNDVKSQQRFLKLWRQNLGHRFIGSLNAFSGWVVRHWPEIKVALGIVALFLDEQPEETIKEEKPKTKKGKGKAKKLSADNLPTDDYVAPPKPAPVDLETDTKVNPWVTANKVKDSE